MKNGELGMSLPGLPAGCLDDGVEEPQQFLDMLEVFAAIERAKLA
jgi:hypothetical protein